MSDATTPSVARHRLETAIMLVFVATVAIGAVVRAKQPPISSPPPAHTAAALRVRSLEGLPLLPGEPLFSLDVVILNGKPLSPSAPQLKHSVKTTDSVVITGWAADRAAGAPADGVFLAVGAARPVALDYGSSRPDVAAALGNPTLERTGFSGRIPLKLLHSGIAPLRFLVVDSAGTGYFAVPPPMSLIFR